MSKMVMKYFNLVENNNESLYKIDYDLGTMYVCFDKTKHEYTVTGDRPTLLQMKYQLLNRLPRPLNVSPHFPKEQSLVQDNIGVLSQYIKAKQKEGLMMADAKDLDKFKERLEICDEIEFDLNGQSWNLESVYKGDDQVAWELYQHDPKYDQTINTIDPNEILRVKIDGKPLIDQWSKVKC